MATVNFYLKSDADKSGYHAILLTYLLRSEKFRFSTKLKTLKKNWDATNQKIKRNGENEASINFLLSEYKRIVMQVELEYNLKMDELTIDIIKEKLKSETGGQRSGSVSFESAFKEYIQNAEIGKTTGIKKIYQGTLNKLLLFEGLTGRKLSFETIDAKFEDSFKSFLYNECDLLNNTVGRYIKTIKSFMNFAVDRGFTTNMKFKKFSVSREEADNISLSIEELMQVYNFINLPDRLSRARDSFCFACFTGLRFSDLSQIKKEHIKTDSIKLTSQKTRDFLDVPLNKYAKEILNKYDGVPPRVISNQKLNDYIKEFCQIVGIDQDIITVQYQGAKRIETKAPKYKFISTHTARRTFVTLSLEHGMRPEVVMSITGHKDYATFKKYIKLTENIKQSEMNEAWSF